MKDAYPYFQAICEERARQDAKWGPQDHNNAVWCAVLTEEVGEACQEVLKERGWLQANERFAAQPHAERLRVELVQIAAVAVAWLEALDRKETA